MSGKVRAWARICGGARTGNAWSGQPDSQQQAKSPRALKGYSPYTYEILKNPYVVKGYDSLLTLINIRVIWDPQVAKYYMWNVVCTNRNKHRDIS